MKPLSFFIVAFVVATSSLNSSAAEPFKIEVAEKGSGWPVPLVQFKTTHHSLFVSDNAGVIAIDSPDLMGQEIWFDIVGHGYEVPKDGFGNRGVRLKPEPGKSAKVEVTRTIIAKRLGRLTGVGLFAESQKLGAETKWRDPSRGVFGCDSIQLAVYQGKRFCFWGDTSTPHYPLGIFNSTGATTTLRPFDKFEPPLRPACEYFVDEKGNPRGIAKMPGDGPTWLFGVVALSDEKGKEHLVGTYHKIKPPLEVYEWGLCEWNDEKSEFERKKVIWNKSKDSPKAPAVPEGHAAFWSDESGKKWVLFGNPLPKLRCAASYEAWLDPKQWEELKPPSELTSVDGKKVTLHTGSIASSEFRQRWVTVFMEKFGKPSGFGELWYAEAKSPLGPWGKAVKILTHENYTFYNPRINIELNDSKSPILLFEGTYTNQFTDHAPPTPRYEYNQMLYRLDLEDEGLKRARE